MNKSRSDCQQWAMWLPLAGWFAISVRLNPYSQWLRWRVYEIRRLPRSRSDASHSLKKQKPHHLRPKPVKDLREYERRAD